MNDVIVRVSRHEDDADQAPLALALRGRIQQKAWQSQLEQSQQTEPERDEQAGHEQVQPGIVGQRLKRRRREEEREEDPDRREDADDRQAINDRQAGRLCRARLFPVLA